MYLIPRQCDVWHPFLVLHGQNGMAYLLLKSKYENCCYNIFPLRIPTIAKSIKLSFVFYIEFVSYLKKEKYFVIKIIILKYSDCMPTHLRQLSVTLIPRRASSRLRIWEKYWENQIEKLSRAKLRYCRLTVTIQFYS